MRTVDYEESITAAVGALSISGALEVSWFGQVIDSVRPLPDDMAYEAAISLVGRLFYRGYYIFGKPRNDLEMVTGAATEALPPSRSPRFIRKVIAANKSSGSWPLRCRIEKDSGDDVVNVQGVRIIVPTNSGDSSDDDRTLEVRLSGVSVTKSPGFVLFCGDQGPPKAEGGNPLMRLYWNVTAQGAISLVAGMTAGLEAVGVPFQLKVLHSDGPWPERSDTGVVYLAREDLITSWDTVRDVYLGLLPMLRPYTPALTRRLGVGLALAEDPGGHESFGTHVCQVMASGVVRAHREGLTRAVDRLDCVKHAFEESRRSIDAPYVNAPENDVPLAELPLPGTGSAPSPTAPPRNWLDRADRLAFEISRQALWHEGRCTWLSREPGSSGNCVPVGADLYNGVAGIGLMYAQLFALTRERTHREQAYGAILRALDDAGGLSGLGLYTGAIGVGLAAALAAVSLDDGTLFDRGCDLVHDRARQFVSMPTRDVPYDLLDGLAGMIIALVGVHHLDSSRGLDLAVGVAAELVRVGRHHDSGGVYWLDPVRQDEIGFVGLAHGASGCALALSEIASASGERAFFRSAERACAYERSWYDSHLQNWPDVRVWHESGGGSDSGRLHGLSRFDWCYGAPGVALARLRLAAEGGSREAEHDAMVAFGRSRTAGGGIVSQLTAAALLVYEDRGPWPAGYGLMMGAAGVAYAALRRSSPELVSPLLLSPRDTMRS